MIKANVDSRMFENKLLDMVKRAKNLGPLFMLIRGEPGNSNPKTIIGQINKTFISQTGPMNESKWSSLSPNYAKWKAKKYPGKSMLIAKGTLFKSLTQPGSDGNVQILEPRKFNYGTFVPYASVHQSGYKTIPQRQFLGVTREQRKVWKILMSKYIQDIKGEK